jgi:hypothetical protein
MTEHNRIDVLQDSRCASSSASVEMAGDKMTGHKIVRIFLTALLPLVLLGNLRAAELEEEVVSFSCALAIDAALAELDEDAHNLVIQQALSTINDKNGQLVCIVMSANEIQVRLQSTDMKASDNRLVLSINAKTYKVMKKFYGR